jgi:predicted dehydrogenase
MKPLSRSRPATAESSASGALPSRREFLLSSTLAAGVASLGFANAFGAEKKVIQGFEENAVDPEIYKGWVPFSDRRIRVGLAGHGLCKFATAFGFQNHPNVEVVAVTDILPDRCAEMAKTAGVSKTYPSLEEMVKDEKIEAVFLATDAANHGPHAITALKHGKHVASSVPAVCGSLEQAEELYNTVKKTGLKYMMFETSCFHEDLYAMRQLYKAGALGRIVYSEGEYFHFGEKPLPSYKGWRVGLPPQWYPTHSNAYYIGVTDGTFTEVSCMGIPSKIEHLQAQNNQYKNPFGTEIALFRTSEGGMSRMGVSWDSPGHEWDKGRVRGEKGSYIEKYEGLEKNLPSTKRPPLPPGMPPGGHGGSHGFLTNEFVLSILQNRSRRTEYDRPRDRGTSIGAEERRAFENPTIQKRELSHGSLCLVGHR